MIMVLFRYTELVAHSKTLTKGVSKPIMSEIGEFLSWARVLLLLNINYNWR